LLAQNLQAAYQVQQEDGGAAAAPAPASSGATTVQIPGNKDWVDTGVAVQAGDAVNVNASGLVSMGGGWVPNPPAGVLGKRCSGNGFPGGPGVPCWSLIGRIGDGAPFYVGNGLTLHATQAGELYLGVNDNQLGDNSGVWTAMVRNASAPASADTGATGASSQPQPNGSPVLTPEIKAMIAEEVKQQLAAERAAAEAGSVQPAADPQTPPALAPANRVFIVSTSMDVAYGSGQECALTPGDILLRTGDTPDSNNKYGVSVQSSKQRDCAAGTMTALGLDDLQEMYNHFQQQTDAGLKLLADKQGRGTVPAAPDTGTTAGEVAPPTPDSDAASQLQNSQNSANAAVQEVNSQSSRLNAPDAAQPAWVLASKRY
jgi:hypothetical protein